jgi:hypothetical protein
MGLVETKRTSPSMRDFALAALKIHPELSKESVGVLWAHFAGETGEGLHCYGWNLGNAKSNGKGDYHALADVWEGVKPNQAKALVATGAWSYDTNPNHAKAVGPGKVSVVATKANPASWFAAYPSLDAGMAAYLKKKREGFNANTWPFVLAGDPEGYAIKLGEGPDNKRGTWDDYYTADPKVYVASMKAKHAKWMAESAYEWAIAQLKDVGAPEDTFHKVPNNYFDE